MIRIALTAGLVLMLASAVFSQDPKTATAKKERFEQKVQFDGVVESANMAEIEADTKVWTELVVQQVVPQGDKVDQGQTVIQFETDKIEQKLQDTEYAMELSVLSLKDEELAKEEVEKTLALDRALAGRTLRIAEEDFDYFKAVGRPQAEKAADNRLKSAIWSLENAREELDQLEKMYTEDELTEESEEIVLKRARRAVEQSEFYLETAQIATKRTLEVELPRQEEQQVDAMERARLEFQKKELILPMTVERKQISLEKSKFGLEKQKRELLDLQADMQLMSLTAPIEGIVYYGRCERGKWVSTTGQGPRTLEPGMSVPADRTILTIVDPENVFVRADLNEQTLAQVKVGMTGKATLMVLPDDEFSVQVESILYVPLAQQTFDCKLQIQRDHVSLMPGLTCKIEMVTYEKDDALTVPAEAVFVEGDQKFVYVQKGDESHKTTVKAGKTSEGKTEILSGLSEGDKVLLEKPKE